MLVLDPSNFEDAVAQVRVCKGGAADASDLGSYDIRAAVVGILISSLVVFYAQNHVLSLKPVFEGLK